MPRNLSQEHYSVPDTPTLVWVRGPSIELPKYTEFTCLYITVPITLGTSSLFTFLAFTVNPEGKKPYLSHCILVSQHSARHLINTEIMNTFTKREIKCWWRGVVHTKEVKVRELNTERKERRQEEEKETGRQPSKQTQGRELELVEKKQIVKTS